MSVLCYNCRGLGEPPTVGNLRSLLRRRSPRVVFLSETKKRRMEMCAIMAKLGDYQGVFEDCMGRSGGLAMLWHHSLKVSLLSQSFHHIDIVVE